MIVFFLSCRFPKPAIHYYANELLIWSDHPWTMLNIWEEKWLRSLHPVPLYVSNSELEGLVCKALSLTENEVHPDDLEACHRLKKKENVIIKFKSRKLKYKVMNNRKIMKNKSKELNELKFSNNLYISESMCAGNHSLFFKCRKLKKARKIFNTWFFNNAINVQLNQNGEIHKIFHTEDLAALLKVDDSFLMNL